ncbi:MAG: xanthine dehydrogenase accessory protein XdhC [Bradyrhizobium sp.]|nr:MAG: xanthine dehydrogenase accessory protein XdhC [Bradyrhizobium sp.]
MESFRRIIEGIEAEGAAALITLVETKGSSPREAGARMVVRPGGGFHGSIGGGELERQALEAALAELAKGRGPALSRSVALGPELGQCCGGRVVWRIETFDARDSASLATLRAAEHAGPFVALAKQTPDGRIARRLQDQALQNGAEKDGETRESFGDVVTPVYLFGAGHVGRALALALAPLPFAVRWIDPRAQEFPKLTPANVAMVAAADPVAELKGAPDGALVAVMTHSHALDLAIVAEALAQGRFPYVGLIGSPTKRARFVSQLRAAGFDPGNIDRLTCPIGVPGVEGKQPAVIAAATAAQLLMARG